VWMAPSESVTVPPVGDGAWVLVATGQTESATLTLTGLAAGRYGHTKFVLTPSTDAIATDQFQLDGVVWTYSAAGGAYSPLSTGVVHIL